jgi:hypothetical protein
MKNVWRSALAAAVAALLISSTGIRSDAAARASAYDGEWSVVIYTLRGDCDQSVRAALRIEGGRVYASDQSFRAAGAVAPNGAITVMVASNERSASGSGRLAGNAGQGRWRTSTGNCSGQWTAERRNW